MVLKCRHVFHSDCLKKWVDSPNPKSQKCLVCNRHIWSERNFDVDESARDLDIDTSLDIVELAVAEYEVELERFADSEHNILPQRAQRVRDLEGVIRGFESQSRGDVLNRLDPGLGQGTDGLELEDEIMPTTIIGLGRIR